MTTFEIGLIVACIVIVILYLSESYQHFKTKELLETECDQLALETKGLADSMQEAVDLRSERNCWKARLHSTLKEMGGKRDNKRFAKAKMKEWFGDGPKPHAIQKEGKDYIVTRYGAGTVTEVGPGLFRTLYGEGQQITYTRPDSESCKVGEL